MTLESSQELTETYTDQLNSPYYVIWWITNQCNLNCVHCVNDSGPYQKFDDELSYDEIMNICKQLLENGVPYGTITGGEPLMHPHFFEVMKYLREKGMNLNLETDAVLINKEIAKKLASLKFQGIHISIDGVSQNTYGIVRRTINGSADLTKVFDAVKMLSDEEVTVAVTFTPTKFSVAEIGKLIDKIVELGAKILFTGRLMRIGRAAGNWKWLSPSEEQYKTFFEDIQKKEIEYGKRIKIVPYSESISKELEFRMDNPAANFVIMPNGKVKISSALPFICADLRKHSLREAWDRYKLAWKSPIVRDFISRTRKDDSLLGFNNQFVELNLENQKTST